MSQSSRKLLSMFTLTGMRSIGLAIALLACETDDDCAKTATCPPSEDGAGLRDAAAGAAEPQLTPVGPINGIGDIADDADASDNGAAVVEQSITIGDLATVEPEPEPSAGGALAEPTLSAADGGAGPSGQRHADAGSSEPAEQAASTRDAGDEEATPDRDAGDDEAAEPLQSEPDECTPGSISCQGKALTRCSAERQWQVQLECPELCVEESASCLASPVIAAFTSSHETVHGGDIIQLSWEVSDAAELSITPDLGSFAPSTTNTAVAMSQTTTFTLTATNAAGSDTASVRVAVTAEGVVDYIRRYAVGALSNGAAWSVEYDPATDQVVTVGSRGTLVLPNGESIDGPFLAIHAPEDGAILDGTTVGTEVTSVAKALALDPTTGSYFVTTANESGKGAVFRIANNLVSSGQMALDAASYNYFGTVAVDSEGNVWTSGLETGALDVETLDRESNAVLLRFDNALTIGTRGALAIEGYDSGQAIAIASDNTLYVGGETEVSFSTQLIQGGRDGFILRYPPGELDTPDHVLQVGGSASDAVTDIAVDSHGDVIVAGETESSLFATNAGSKDVFLAKYSGDLQVQHWAVQLGVAGSDRVQGVAIDDADNVILTGETHGSLFGVAGESSDIIAAAFSSQGDILWQCQLAGSGDDGGSDITTDSKGHVYIAGFGEDLPGAVGATGDRSAVLIRLR